MRAQTCSAGLFHPSIWGGGSRQRRYIVQRRNGGWVCTGVSGVRVCGVEYYPLELASGAGEQSSSPLSAQERGEAPPLRL